jgi:hypothetical protein
MTRHHATRATAARLRRCGPLRAPEASAQINETGTTEQSPPHRCTSNLTPGTREQTVRAGFVNGLEVSREPLTVASPGLVCSTHRRSE